MTADQIKRLLGIVRGFVDPVQHHHGIPVRLDMGCLRQDAEKLLKEIDSEPKTIEHVLVANSLDDIVDLVTWLDEHPSDDELQQRAIDPSVRWDAMAFLNGVVCCAHVFGRQDAFPVRLRLPDNKDMISVLELVIEDYAEVEAAHHNGFETHIEAIED